MTSNYQSPTADDRILWDLHLSAYPLAAVLAADELGLFQALAEAPADLQSFAERHGYSERGVRALLPMLASLGLLEVRDGVFSASNAARNFLLPSSEYYWGPVLTVMRNANPSCAGIVQALKAPTRGELAHVEAWESATIDDAMAKWIGAYMHSHSLAAAVGVARSGCMTGVRRLLDVGGGSGCYAIALAQTDPDIRCTVMDIKGMCEVADGYIAAGGVSGRVDTAAIDMFREDWPGGYDGMLFSNVFHDWDFKTCRVLAAKAFAALAPGGRIFLHEILLDDTRGGPLTPAAFSIQMLLSTRGQQFTFGDLREILEEAGFETTSAVSTHAYFSVVIASKPS